MSRDWDIVQLLRSVHHCESARIAIERLKRDTRIDEPTREELLAYVELIRVSVERVIDS